MHYGSGRKKKNENGVLRDLPGLSRTSKDEDMKPNRAVGKIMHGY